MSEDSIASPLTTPRALRSSTSRLLKTAHLSTDQCHVADAQQPTRHIRRARIEASVFATFAVLHLPGTVVALSRPRIDISNAVLAVVSVLTGLLLWSALTALAVSRLRRVRLVPRGLLAAALAVDTIVLTVSGLSPPRTGNITAATAGVLAICAAAALLTRPRLLPVVLVPAVTGQVVLLNAADAGAGTARLVADVVTVTAACVATGVLIAWLEHDRRSGHAALAAAASTDPLTGLLNRRALDEGLSRLFEGSGRATRSHRRRRRTDAESAVSPPDGDEHIPGGDLPSGESSLAHVVVIDIDHFKAVNDRRGHEVGDAVIIAVAQALRECSRRGDLLVRMGGEELAWVARWPTAGDAVAAVERLRGLVAVRTEEFGEPVTVSAGIAPLAVTGVSQDLGAISTPGRPFAEALRRADEALYRAKAGGRDRAEVAPPLERPDDQRVSAPSGSRST